MNKLPQARTQNIVMQNLDKEVLLYDLQINKAFRLNETCAIVYRACDGKTELDELINKHNFTEELIYFSLQELQKENLVEGNYLGYFGALSRREVIQKVGLATMLALPLISSLIAPTAAQAQSVTCFNQTCTFNNFTQSDCCNANFRCYNSTSPATCTTCFPNGTRFFFAAPAANDAFCNAQPAKNVCCDSGPVTGDGSWCYCPGV